MVARLPNFIIIGAAKSGTTSLYHYLQQHPQIFLSRIKEPRYFALFGNHEGFQGPGDHKIMDVAINDFESYTQLFDGVKNETAIGEASSWYLYYSKAAKKIFDCIPDVKLIVILRNPVERAYSSFLHLQLHGRETLTDFGVALDVETERIKANWEPLWHYKQMGFYCSQLRHYYDLFDGTQIKVLLFDDFKRDPLSLVHEIYRFLKVDDRYTPSTDIKYNVTGIPKNKIIKFVLRRFITRPNLIKTIIKSLMPSSSHRSLSKQWVKIRNRQIVKPRIDQDIQRELLNEYRDDILQLQDLINRDLSQWLICI